MRCRVSLIITCLELNQYLRKVCKRQWTFSKVSLNWYSKSNCHSLSLSLTLRSRKISSSQTKSRKIISSNQSWNPLCSLLICSQSSSSQKLGQTCNNHQWLPSLISVPQTSSSQNTKLSKPSSNRLSKPQGSQWCPSPNTSSSKKSLKAFLSRTKTYSK